MSRLLYERWFGCEGGLHFRTGLRCLLLPVSVEHASDMKSKVTDPLLALCRGSPQGVPLIDGAPGLVGDTPLSLPLNPRRFEYLSEELYEDFVYLNGLHGRAQWDIHILLELALVVPTVSNVE